MITISYRRQDSEAITGRIFDRLTLRWGKEAIFRDIDNIPVGVDFREYINNVLGESAILLVIIGPRWLGELKTETARIHDEIDLVRIEVETALRLDIPIIPVLVDNAQMPSASILPESIQPLAYRNAVRIDAAIDFDNHIQRLLRSVEGTLSATTVPVQPPTGPTRRGSRLRTMLLAATLLVLAAGVLVVAYWQGLKPKQPNELATALPASPSASQSQELTAALNNKRPELLRVYLEKYPHNANQSELLDKLNELTRAEYTEWSMFNSYMDKPVYLKISSIETLRKSRVAMLIKGLLDRSLPTYIKDVPDGAYQEALEVYDCDLLRFWDSEVTYYSSANNVIFHYKWANPSLVENISDPQKPAEGSISTFAKFIACDEQLRTPTVTKEELAKFQFASLSSTPAGDGDLFYKIVGNETSVGDRRVLLIARFREKKRLADTSGGSAVKAFEGLAYIEYVDLLKIDCKDSKSTAIKVEYYDENNTLIIIAPLDPAKPGAVADMPPKSPLGQLREVTCSGN